MCMTLTTPVGISETSPIPFAMVLIANSIYEPTTEHKFVDYSDDWLFTNPRLFREWWVVARSAHTESYGRWNRKGGTKSMEWVVE